MRLTLALLLLVACGKEETSSPSSEAGTTSSSGGSSGGGGSSGTGSSSGSNSEGGVDAGPCRIERVDDPNYGASGGPRGCTQPSDCSIRYTGDYCCPNEPQAMTNSRALLFDESLNGFGQECREPCKTVRCAAPPDASAQCVDGGCSL